MGLIAFAAQFSLNVLWSFLFFGLRSPFFGLVGIVLLWLAIVLTIMRFYKVSKKAAWLLVPYILWVSFAGTLNFMIWQMNLWQ
jgi:tryptophan-rich sensory protein